MDNIPSKPFNPWTQIWIAPRETLRQLFSASQHMIISLAIIGGVISSLSWLGLLWTQYPHQEEFQRITFIILFAIIGALLGLANLYFGAWLYKITGSWIGGIGNFRRVKYAVGWANYPFIIAGLFNIFSFLAAPNVWLEFIFSFINMVLLLWGIILFINLLAEAHQFSAWRGLWSIFIAAALIFVAIMAIALLVSLLVT